MAVRNKVPLPFLILALLALLAGLWAGLLRLGWSIPILSSGLALAHGPMMVSGFLGTLITLERVVALRQRWLYAVPALTGSGWLITLLVPARGFGPVLLTLGSLGGLIILAIILKRDPGIHSATMASGMLAWLAGNSLWLAGRGVFQVVYWWQAFLILTILGERLELNRVLKSGRNLQWLFGSFAVAMLAGLLLGIVHPRFGTYLVGASMLALAVWSLPNDIAWRNLRHKLPLTRYIAWCLAPGFVWLAVGGLLNLGYGPQTAGPFYDATLHAVFIGFVISMIFGHAPIIFPAILGTPLTFHRVCYLQLLLLHLSLFLRLLGDLGGSFSLRQWGGLLNEVAILLFLATTLYSVRRAPGKS